MVKSAVMSERPLNSNPSLVVDNICVAYGNLNAVKNLSFTANRGELVGIIGPNGAGKSTLVRSICGHQPIDSGRIAIGANSDEPGNITPAVVGLVPQEIGLYESLTAKENLVFFARAAGLKGASATDAAHEALVAVGLSSHQDKQVCELSGGMKRRINFAAAILSQPELLILDEPTVGVDAGARDDLMALAVQYARRGMSILLISHELDQIEKYCDRVLVIANGVRQYFAPPAHILQTAFGAAREIRLEVERPVSQMLFEKMTASNLVHHPSDQCWTGFWVGDPAAASKSMYAMMSNYGNAVRELTLRKPGLEMLIQRLGRTPVTNAPS